MSHFWRRIHLATVLSLTVLAWAGVWPDHLDSWPWVLTALAVLLAALGAVTVVVGIAWDEAHEDGIEYGYRSGWGDGRSSRGGFFDHVHHAD